MIGEEPSLDDLLGRQGMADRRHMLAALVGDADVKLRLKPDGYCQWCGRDLGNSRRRLCSVKNEQERGETGYYDNYSMCQWAYTQFWYARPRFRRAVLVRDNFTCKECGAKPIGTNQHGVELPALEQLHIDHIIPFSKGGPTTLGNLRVLCRKCNLAKGAKEDWEQGQEVALPAVPLFDYAGVEV